MAVPYFLKLFTGILLICLLVKFIGFNNLLKTENNAETAPNKLNDVKLRSFTDKKKINSQKEDIFPDRQQVVTELKDERDVKIDIKESNDRFLWDSLKSHTIYEAPEIDDSLLALRLNKNWEKQFNSEILKDKLSFVNSIPKYKAPNVDCQRFFNNDTNYISKKILEQNSMKLTMPDEKVLNATNDCKNYRKEYVTIVPSKDEADFPLAFQILAFKNAAQLELLLKAIYRPHNEYCIHIDKKSTDSFRNTIVNIAKCFDNIDVIHKEHSINVQWGYQSVLEPELICMRNLWSKKTKWKYLINLTGQEYPLQSMQDLTKILKILNGANSIEAISKRRHRGRTSQSRFYKDRKQPFHWKVNLVQGAVHITAQRGFIDYILHNPIALAFSDWLRDSFHPDETLFSSLNHSPALKAPGSYTGEAETDPIKYPFITRFKNWGVYPSDYPCAGKRVRWVCILSIGDLPLLKEAKQLFANKFYLDYQPQTLECLREMIYNRTRDGILGKHQIDLNYYKNLPIVKNHIGLSP